MVVKTQIGRAKRPKSRAGASGGGAHAEVVEATGPKINPSADPVNWSMVYLFARIFYEVRLRTEESLRPHGLTPMQFTILTTLNRWNGLSSADLSRRFNVTPQTMGEMISNLERRALLVRTPDPANRRALRLRLTEEGRRTMALCNATMDALEASLLEEMAPAEIDGLKRQLRMLHDHLGLRDDLTEGRKD